MKIVALTEKGCEEFAALELNKRFGVNCHKKWFLEFSSDLEKCYDVLMFSQSITDLLIKINSGSFKDMKDISLQNLVEIKEIIGEKTVKISCTRKGNHDFNSVELEKFLAEKTDDLNFELKNPDFYINVYVQDNEFVIGLSLAGRDLSKRQYRVFNHPNSLKGTTAFCALIYSEKIGGDILDPGALSGVIPIEAAFYQSNFPVNFYEPKFALNKIKEIKKEYPKKTPKNIFSIDKSFKNVSAQKKNSKIAGVEKHIKFSRTDLENIDLKLYKDKDQLDLIITRGLDSSKRVSQKSSLEYYEKLLSQSKQVLKTKGVLTIITQKPKTIEDLVKCKKVEVWQGNQKIYFVKVMKDDL